MNFISESKNLILIIDDQKTAAELLARMIISYGYQTAKAFNGPDGIEKATSLQPDLILLDVMMPKMDGYEVLKKLRKDEKTHDIPVIMVTVKDHPDDVATGLNLGAEDYIPKPINPGELIARIKAKIRVYHTNRQLLSRTQELEARTKELESLISFIDPVFDNLSATGKLFSTFISYSHRDRIFAKKLYTGLVKAGISVWLDETKLHIGQGIFREVYRAIHKEDRTIIICSEHSLKSEWVNLEVTAALEREKELQMINKDTFILMPVRVDDYIFSDDCKFEWKKEITKRLVGDFISWKNPAEFQKSLDLLIRSLQLM